MDVVRAIVTQKQDAQNPEATQWRQAAKADVEHVGFPAKWEMTYPVEGAEAHGVDVGSPG